MAEFVCTGDTCTIVDNDSDESNELKKHLEQSQQIMQERMKNYAPKIGIILGSGLGLLADRIEDPVFIPYGEVPHMKCSTAVTHIGRFVVGKLGEKDVIAMQGRLHGYEGYTSQEVVYPVRLMHELGVKTLMATNAVGAINESYNVGDFCIMSDHINFTGRNPVVGIDPDGLAPRFFSLFDAYDPSLRELAHRVADDLNIAVQEGVYLGLLGPSFETPAEIRAFRVWGADTVAMSVCEEVIAARHLSMRVFGMSFVANMACGVKNTNPDDVDVLEAVSHRSEDFCRLMTGIIEHIED